MGSLGVVFCPFGRAWGCYVLTFGALLDVSGAFGLPFGRIWVAPINSLGEFLLSWARAGTLFPNLGGLNLWDGSVRFGPVPVRAGSGSGGSGSSGSFWL